MGFLSKLFGRSAGPPPPPPPPFPPLSSRPLQEIVEEANEEFDLGDLEPRDQHYLFAHRVLPAIARRSPGNTLEDLSDPESCDGVLRLIWDIPAEDLTGRDLVSPDGLSALVRRFEVYRIGLVTLPPPAGMTEAYFVALVFGSAPDEDGEIQTVLCRYFALECTLAEESVLTQRRTLVPKEGDPSTVLGEWTETSHFNYGAGPSPKLDLFFERVCAMLRETPDLHARTSISNA